jgi:VWFA-related protein
LLKSIRLLAVLLTMLLLFVFLSPSFSESKKAKRELIPEDQSTFKVPVNVVVVNATVTDKDGHPVRDLTANDFKVYDDGIPQQIQTFALESLDSPDSDSSRSTDSLQGQAPGNPKLISIVIDDLTLYSSSDLVRIVDAVKSFIEKDVAAGVQVAILSGSRSVRFPFSGDREMLLGEANSIMSKLNLNLIFHHGFWDREAWSIAHDEPGYSDLPVFLRVQAKRQNDEAEYRTHSLLYTIRQHLRALRHFEGTKEVVIFSDGFLSLKGTPAAYELQEIINLALHSGIILNAVGTRGVPTPSLIAQMLGSNADSIPTTMMMNYTADTIDQESSLAQIASDTGGQFHSGNDMHKGIRESVRRQIFYYILTYSLPPHEADGSYRKITLDLARSGLKVAYRKGYYAPKEELTFENTKREDLIDALGGPGNMKEIPITLAYNYFQEDESTYAVSFVTNVDIRKLRFPEEEGRRKNQLSFVLVAFDENDHYISGIEKLTEFRLLESNYTNLLKRGLTSRVEFKLPIGRYKIKAVVREDIHGKMGSIAKSVEIP